MSSSSIWPENSAEAPSSSSPLVPPPNGIYNHSNPRLSNVSQLLAKREVLSQTRRSRTQFWGKSSSRHIDACGIRRESIKDVRQELLSWVEAESLLKLSAKYCPLQPPPRSTIAVAFSPDGKTLASTHGDHTVKIIDSQTGKCLKVLSGHLRTPWVVRFHPLHPEVLASGSLDHEVRLWDAKTAECIGSRDFYRPIASIAFHAQGDILAVASGHKLYTWHYKRGEASSPTMILKTRRSLRAVHFHPHAAPFLLTAEVNDLDSSDPSMALATSPGYLRYTPTTIHLGDIHSTYQSNSRNELPIMSIPFLSWPSSGRGDGSLPFQQANAGTGSNVLQQRGNSLASMQLRTYPTTSEQYEPVLSPMESSVHQERQNDPVTREMVISQPAVDAMETDLHTEERSDFSSGAPTSWDILFSQGWLIGRNQAGLHAMRSQNGPSTEGFSSSSVTGNPSSVVHAVIPNNISNPRISESSGSHHRSSRPRMIPATTSVDNGGFNSIPFEHNNPQRFTSQVQSDVATSLAAAATIELPCTVKLRIWSHDVKSSCAPLDTKHCRLIIPHAVLCSEMGAHFSPCGRFLAVCVACILPNMDADLGFHSDFQFDVTGASTSPTRHPISSHQFMYELRIYSLEKATFGSILASRAIRAAHCLTSIQFSPTSEHLLLAYGRRHSSLLRSVVVDGDTTVPVYTILEIYRVSDMELVRILPSAEDEVNVACFHPSVGGGLVYGTKEGKLRILQCDISHSFNNEGPVSPMLTT